MKKFFTLVVMATFAFVANAQTETGFVNLNVVSDAAVNKEAAESVNAGTELCTSENVTMKAAFDDTYIRSSLWGETDAVNKITIDGVDYEMPMGLQGQANPKDNSLLKGGQKSGAVFRFDVKADGILYVFAKLTGNKNYYVWEGNVLNEDAASPVAYTLIAAQANDGKVVGYKLPGNEAGYYVVGTGYDDGTKYLEADRCTEIQSIESVSLANDNVPETKKCTVWNNCGDEKVKGNALGVIAFPVYAEAKEYYVNACGSKVTANGFLFVKGATEVGAVTFSKGETAGISGIAAASVAKKAVKKALVNGRLVIEKDGKQFSVAGAQVK